MDRMRSDSGIKQVAPSGESPIVPIDATLYEGLTAIRIPKGFLYICKKTEDCRKPSPRRRVEYWDGGTIMKPTTARNGRDQHRCPVCERCVANDLPGKGRPQKFDEKISASQAQERAKLRGIKTEFGEFGAMVIDGIIAKGLRQKEVTDAMGIQPHRFRDLLRLNYCLTRGQIDTLAETLGTSTARELIGAIHRDRRKLGLI